MNHLTTDLLNLYLDDALESQTRAEADAHLAACAECARELAALRTVFAALAALPDVPIPVDVSSSVVARLAPTPAVARLPLVAALSTQIVLGMFLAGWLLPAWEDLGGWLVSGSLAELQGAWDAVLAGTQAMFESRIETGLDPTQWGVIIGLVGVVWLSGNLALGFVQMSPRTMEVKG